MRNGLVRRYDWLNLIRSCASRYQMKQREFNPPNAAEGARGASCLFAVTLRGRMRRVFEIT